MRLLKCAHNEKGDLLPLSIYDQAGELGTCNYVGQPGGNGVAKIYELEKFTNNIIFWEG